jgi:hypothetical protein
VTTARASQFCTSGTGAGMLTRAGGGTLHDAWMHEGRTLRALAAVPCIGAGILGNLWEGKIEAGRLGGEGTAIRMRTHFRLDDMEALI